MESALSVALLAPTSRSQVFPDETGRKSWTINLWVIFVTLHFVTLPYKDAVPGLEGTWCLPLGQNSGLPGQWVV
jgi:hypothetical protein